MRVERGKDRKGERISLRQGCRRLILLGRGEGLLEGFF